MMRVGRLMSRTSGPSREQSQWAGGRLVKSVIPSVEFSLYWCTSPAVTDMGNAMFYSLACESLGDNRQN